MNVPVARRIIAASLVVIASVGVGALPASAHGTNGQPIPDPAHYLSQITGFGPAMPGLTASIDPRGEWIEVTNTSGKNLTILGYAREPYLQITSSGVAENTYSPTLALNQSLFGHLSQLGDSALPRLGATSAEHRRCAGTIIEFTGWARRDHPPSGPTRRSAASSEIGPSI